jgi:hypothetical protein
MQLQSSNSHSPPQSHAHGRAKTGRSALPLGNVTDFIHTGPKRPIVRRKKRRIARLRMGRKTVPDSRMALCLYGTARGRDVQVVLSEDGEAGYGGVIRCGLRACPWCAAIEAAQDVRRATAAARAMVERGSMLLLVAFTMEHHVGEDLAEQRQAFTDAQTHMHNSRGWSAFYRKYGVGERFHGNELTDGANGWHFHRHTVYEVKLPREVRDRAERREFAAHLERELKPLWLESLSKHGRSANWERGLKVTVSGVGSEAPEAAARYVTNFALEATAGAFKSARAGGRSPWQLLDDAADKTLSAAQRARARVRFREFVSATKGMHWTWFSDGCKVSWNLEEVEWVDDAGVPVLTLSAQEWKVIRALDLQLWFLELVETIGPAAAHDELKRICNDQRWSKRWRRLKPEELPPGGELMDVSF